MDYTDKAAVLTAFKKQSSGLEIRDQLILVSADYSVEVIEKRNAFPCLKLYRKQMRFALPYPVTRNF